MPPTEAIQSPAFTPRWTSAGLASRLGAELRGPGDVALNRLDTLEDAGPDAVTFIREAKHAARWSASRAGAALVSRRAFDEAGAAFAGEPTAGRAVLIVPDADRAMIELLTELAPNPLAAPTTPGHRSIHPEARVDPTAQLGAHVVVGPGSVIGPGSVLHAHVVIGSRVTIGAGTVLHPCVVVQDGCSIGSGCILHPGVVVGSDGFGYRPSPDGKGILKIPHIGNVEIGDAVEIGANTTIDRGKFGATRIGSMTKIDNLVQIAHNCRIGRACFICGCSGLAGSVTLEDGVTLAGGVAIGDGRTIGRGATIGARSGVMDNVPPGETWLGAPARPMRQTLRTIAAMDQLPELLREARKAMGLGTNG
ncbi:MAG: UDP-3-O-(3-hydroxymyristoyl)glucosamine N-acyltransferase [Phycisphaerales bacterium]